MWRRARRTALNLPAIPATLCAPKSLLAWSKSNKAVSPGQTLGPTRGALRVTLALLGWLA